VAACILSIESERDLLGGDAAKIAARLQESEANNGVFFNRNMWRAFTVVFPEYQEQQEQEQLEQLQELEQQQQEQEQADEISVDSLRDGLELGDYGEYVNDYRDSSAYICDMVAEIADNNTSIYYSDIMHFIGENPEALADVIEEGLYDPSHGYDLHQHGQAAEYMTIERDLWNHLEDALYLAALDFIRYDMERETIPAELAELLQGWAADPGDRMSDIPDRIREYFHDAQEDDGE
jgi:hypothetical protein